MTWRTSAAAFLLLTGCSGTAAPRMEPSIGFDKSDYVVTLSPDGTQILSTTPGTIVVSRGSDPFPPHVFIYLLPEIGNCGSDNAGPGFASPAVVGPYPDDFSTHIDVNIRMCPVLTPFGYPRGVTPITAQYTFRNKTYSAHATVTVQ